MSLAPIVLGFWFGAIPGGCIRYMLDTETGRQSLGRTLAWGLGGGLLMGFAGLTVLLAESVAL